MAFYAYVAGKLLIFEVDAKEVIDNNQVENNVHMDQRVALQI